MCKMCAEQMEKCFKTSLHTENDVEVCSKYNSGCPNYPFKHLYNAARILSICLSGKRKP